MVVFVIPGPRAGTKRDVTRGRFPSPPPYVAGAVPAVAGAPPRPLRPPVASPAEPAPDTLASEPVVVCVAPDPFELSIATVLVAFRGSAITAATRTISATRPAGNVRATSDVIRNRVRMS